ncbi:7214_t:CDS:2, partial [Funneliformis geosporum]
VTNSPRKQRTLNTTPKPAVEEVVSSLIEAKTEKEKEIYRKVVPVEHVLNITYVPALYKIVDEIFVNAVDNKKISGGRNGLSAKLTNIYSTEFILETSSNGKIYCQTFRNNSNEIEQPIITDHPLYKKEVDFKSDYTLVKFKPDFQKFKISRFDDDKIALIKKRVYDLAGE